MASRKRNYYKSVWTSPASCTEYVTENNIGIEITSLGKTAVRSVFKGEVTRVFLIKGAI